MKHGDYQDESAKVSSAFDYDYYADTKDHHRCLWNDQGERCTRDATVITTTLATKTKQLPGGPHLSAIKGGYCSDHAAEMETGKPRYTEPRLGGEDWRDRLVREYTAAHRDDPLVARAELIAQGKGSDDDKSDLLHDLASRLGGAVERWKI